MPGHPHDLSDEQTETIRKRRAEGGTLEQIAAELKVHHSTVARYVQETEPAPRPSDRYTELVDMLRGRIEANIADTIEAIDAQDRNRLDWLMKVRMSLTQQAKGLLQQRDIFPNAQRPSREPNEQEQAFVAGLAAGQVIDGNGGGDRGKRAVRRAASRTSASKAKA